MILQAIDVALFVIFLIPVGYLVFFSLASMLRRHEPKPTRQNPHTFLILIPAYKEDAVIKGCVEACLAQDYPRDKYQIIVIAEGMHESTLQELEALSIVVKRIVLKHRTKAKALNKALRENAKAGWEIALVFDADNIPEPLFLQKMNAKFHEGAVAVQGHRTAKNQNNSLAVLDAMSEEINNSIFRKGHYNVGLSSALIGSGMAFRFEQFNSIMRHVDVVGGFDKELEHIYLMNKVKIHYLHNAIVLDEKIQKKEHFARQRRRWMAAQWEHFSRFVPLFVMGVRQSNLDFCNKIFQMILIPRILIVGGVSILTLINTVFAPELSTKWWFLLITFLIAFFIAIPRRLVSKKLFIALLSLPHIFLIVFMNMFKLRNANKKFIHTPHQ